MTLYSMGCPITKIFHIFSSKIIFCGLSGNFTHFISRDKCSTEQLTGRVSSWQQPSERLSSQALWESPHPPRENVSSPPQRWRETLINTPQWGCIQGILWNVNWVLIERTRLSGLLSADRIFLGAYVVKLFRATNQQMLKSSPFTQTWHILTEKEQSHWRNIYISCMSTEPYLIPHQNNTWSLKM